MTEKKLHHKQIDITLKRMSIKKTRRRNLLQIPQRTIRTFKKQKRLRNEKNSPREPFEIQTCIIRSFVYTFPCQVFHLKC